MSKFPVGHLADGEREQAEALQLYRLAAEQGVAGAQCRLGVMFAQGRGVTPDPGESVRWFRLAAEQGDAEAQGALGLAYAEGRGVTKDFVMAHMWMTLAVAGLTGPTRDGAFRFRESIAAMMSGEAVAKADILAERWKPTSGHKAP